ncbi:IPT/TIG domain-containing protein [Flavobacterium sp.]|uniref:IPT/TIG domain-containing protein n=1 Tax=Flavobacterium sp. TaxID=239 RepID=UPI0038FCCF43
MKNIKNNKINSLLAFIFTLFLLSSCSKDDSNDSSSNNPPVITGVAAAVNTDGTPSDLTPITQGYANNMYIIRGSGFKTTKKIYFNEKETFFKPTLVTDTEIFVTVDINTPYENASEELKVVTENGTATYHFVIAPPAPIVSSVNPINTADGTDITIKGNYFLNPIVKVGALTATVVSTSLTEIHATLPIGSQLKKVSVTTISGTGTYNSAIGTAYYDDSFYYGMTAGGWGESHDIADTSNVTQGDTAMKCTIQSWSGFQIDGNVPMEPTATGIRFKMKVATDAQIRLVFNYDWSKQFYMNITSSYKEYFVSWADLGLVGPPAAYQSLVFGSTGDANTFYIDDFGFSVN